MRRHPATLAAAGISPARYDELKNICRQYREYKRQLNLARAGVSDKKGGSGAWRKPDPTGNAAVALADHPCARRVRIIEQCAKEAAEPPIAQALLKSVTQGVSYEHLRPPCGARQFYGMRLAFFIRLDARLWEEG